LWRHEQLVPLSPKPLAVLATLVAQAGQVVTKEALLDAVWADTAVTEGVLKGCIRQRRRVLGETAAAPQYIATVHRRGYRFLATVTPLAFPPAPSPLATPHTAALLVGREVELAQLHQWWAQACQGMRQLVFITGEAGIGKTTLVDAFIAQVAASDTGWNSRGQCIAHYGAGEPYLPLLEALSTLAQGPAGVQLRALLRQQAPSWLMQLPALVSDAELEGLQRRTSGTTQERMLRELADAMEALTVERPLVLVLEDLHWSDVSTLDWLAYIARRREVARLLVLGTYRPTDAIVHGHPVHPVSQELQRHAQGAELILGYFPETAVTAYLAQRFGGQGLPKEIVRALHQRTTGNPLFAVQRSAHQEALAHLHNGLAVLATLPDTAECHQHELTLQLLLGVSLTATKGYAAPEVEHAYTRAWELCQQLGKRPQHFSVLSGLWRLYTVRGEVQTGRMLAEQLLHLAQDTHDATLLLEAHYALGNTLLWLGEFAQAHAHLAQGLTLATSQQQPSLDLFQGQDPGVCCRSFAACTLWYLGYPDQALQQSHAAVTLAWEQSHAFSLALALNFAVELYQLRQEWQSVQEATAVLLALAHEQGFALWSARAMILQGWTLAKQAQGEQGIAQVQQGLVAYQTTGAERGRPYYLLLLAEAYGIAGRPEAGLATLAEALAVLHKTGEHIYKAEIHRLKGELLLTQSQDNQADAEACFQHALDVARHQHAKALELRAAISLTRLWQQRGKYAEARELLAPTYGWFTEGFDTTDLQEAKALLYACSNRW
jgi:predicted ATPase